jgi:hypothetical protein
METSFLLFSLAYIAMAMTVYQLKVRRQEGKSIQMICNIFGECGQKSFKEYYHVECNAV